MSLSALALLIAASLYTGFQWTIRLVVYPQLTGVGRPEFVAYEARHQHLVTWAVGPLFAALMLTTGAVAVHPPDGAAWWLVGASVLLAALILGVTGLLAVPQHRTLSAGFDPAAHRRLLRVDTVRLVAAAVDTVVATTLLLR